MRKNVLIIEDDEHQAQTLKKLVLQVNGSVNVHIADNPADAYRILMEVPIDVFLVDIILKTVTMGDTAGVLLVEKLRKLPQYIFTPVIFVTSLEDPEMYCYKDLNCIGYIEKPYDRRQILKLVEKALNYTTYREENVKITFRKDGILYPVEVKDIVYIESINHILHIHLQNGTMMKIPYRTCRQIMEEIDSGTLVQCSRSTIVNREYISSVDIVNQCITFRDNLGSANIGITYKRRMVAEFGG